MAQTILYYPTINIQDGTWLRNAILYWDEVSSIVPYENYPDFSPELLYLQELGVYKAVYPRNLFFSEFAEDFCNSIVKRISAYELRTTNNGTQNSRVRILVKSLHLQSKQVHHYLTLELATSIIETRLVQQKQTVVLATLLRQTEMG